MRRQGNAASAGVASGWSSATIVGALTTLLAAAVLATCTSPATAANCPNELRRTEQGVTALALPNCRAYELVSPDGYPQQATNGESRGASASLDGDALAYFEYYPAADAQSSGMFYLSKRGTQGWVSKTAAPQMAGSVLQDEKCEPAVVFSVDLSLNVLQAGRFLDPDEKHFCKTNEAVIDSRENRDYANLFIHSNFSDAYQLLSAQLPGAPPANNEMRGGSSDLGTVVFSASDTELTPEDPPGENYYVWSNGVVRLLARLPDGTPFAPPVGSESISLLGQKVGEAAVKRSISTDGNRIFFYTLDFGRKLYVRLNPAKPQSAINAGQCTEAQMGCTVEVDKSQGPGADGGAQTAFASADGSTIYFTSVHRLTADSTAQPSIFAGKSDLYRYDVDTGTLTDLTVHPGEPAGVGGISWVNPNGSYVFFTAGASLAPGALSGGNCPSFEVPGCNLYMEHEGVITFIATLAGEGAGSAQSSPDGEFFAFSSKENLTAYDSEGKVEIYLYDTATKQLECASCPEIGQAAISNVSLPLVSINDGAQSTADGQRSVINGGRVFFETEDGLVPEDTNETRDVYMYEDGAQYILSGGKTENRARFLAASSDGADVFFITAEPLLPGDSNGTGSIYDARIGGGFPEPPPLSGCEGEACRAAGTNAATGIVGTGSFFGPGDGTGRHRADCGLLADRALRVSREAKRLRHLAEAATDHGQAARLRRQASRLAAKGKDISKNAKRCKRANRRTGK